MWKCFAVYDCKVEAYFEPFFFKTSGEAIRAIGEAVNKPEHNFCKYAADFTLFELGSWNEVNASFDLLKTPHNLGVLIEFKKDL